MFRDPKLKQQYDQNINNYKQSLKEEKKVKRVIN